MEKLRKKQKTEYKKIPEEPEDPNKPKDFKLHSTADQVVKFNDQMRSSGQSVLDVLKGRVPGLSVGNSGAMFRGPSSIYMNNQPLYLIDGIPTDYEGIQSINIQDVEYVEILKGPSSAIYGLRGANGVIAVYTKKGYFYKRGEIRFKMLGYHTPRVFYSPKYSDPAEEAGFKEYEDTRRTITWLPEIITGNNGIAHVSFWHSDVAGEFIISMEGYDDEGNYGIKRQRYSVK